MRRVKKLKGTLIALGMLAIWSTGVAQVDTALPWAKPEAGSNTIDFGAVPVGQTATATYSFKLLETSETSAVVTITRPNAPFALQDAPTGSFALAPGQSIDFFVTFTPPNQGSYTGAFTITTEGGYPPRRTTTTVNLTGQGVAEGATSPPDEKPPSTGITLPFILPLPGSEAPTEAIPGETDDAGEFSVSVSLTTAVTGYLGVCADGQPVANQPFTLTKITEGYEIAVAGFLPVTAREAGRVSLFGLTSIDLGEICLTPVPREEEVPAAKPICEVKYEWLRKTPIEIVEPLDYFPKQTTMPLGGIIAFHIRASDKDVLRQTCYGCVDGEAVKRIGPVADVVSNHWSLLSLTPHSPDPAGELLGWSAGNYGDILYQLPEELPDGMFVMDYLDCVIDDLEGPLAKGDDDPLYATASICITGQAGNTCKVSILLTQPGVSPYDDDIAVRAAEDCNPAEAVWEEESKLWVSSYVPDCMCAGQLYRLHVHPSCIDVDFLQLECDAATCDSSEAKIRVNDPTTPIWSDNGAGGTFPFGNRGFGVIYQAPSDGKEMKVTCRIDDSGTQYDDAEVQNDSTCTTVRIVNVLPGDPTTHEIPSVLPGADLPRQHFVTVRQTGSGQDKMRLQVQIEPNTDAARQCITWEGAEADPGNHLVGLVPRTAALRRPVQVQVGDRTCKRLMAWVIWCTLASPDDSRKKTAGYDPPDYDRWVAVAEIYWVAQIKPIEIITDADHPDLEGENKSEPHEAGSRASTGELLDRGVNTKWDISRQVRTRSYYGNPLVLDANPSPINDNPAYPQGETTGNDDKSTEGEDNNPYDAQGSLGELTDSDRPRRQLQAFVGRLGDRCQWKLQFREFVRVELDGNWYRCSDWDLWRFHIAAVFGPIDSGAYAWGLDDPPGLILEPNNDDWEDP
jgi:hypothetical protein